MKRIILTVILVAAFSACAQATLSLLLDGIPAPPEATLIVSSDVLISGLSNTSDPYIVYLQLVNPGTTGEWSSDLWTIWPPPEIGYEPVDGVWIIENPGGYLAGVQWEVHFSCKAQGDATINLLTGDEVSIIDSITFHQVPEPMTIALLGIGGLLLHRRRS